jgi:hypothetical protein
MIERLARSLETLSAGGVPSARASADFSDAYRLVVDCPQFELDPDARQALDTVEKALDRVAAGQSVGDLARLATRALSALGVGSRKDPQRKSRPHAQ